jgi:hypothetical protein
MASRQRHILEFTHPGLEYQPGKRRSGSRDFLLVDDGESDRKGVRQWNELGGHRRKFLRCGGHYISSLDEAPKSGKISFWGEWEAQSWMEELPRHSSGDRPRFVHYPFLDNSYSGDRRHNTDPFVFGDHFWYTNCKQKPGGVASRLEAGSVILFGTEFKEGFRLDTVFVVGMSWQQDELPAELISSAPAQLRSTNFEHNNLCRDPEKQHLRFYRGLSHGEDPSFFSFVPCKASVGGPFIHDRILLSPWQEFCLTKKPGAKAICARLFRDEMKEQGIESLAEWKARWYWSRIASYCLDQGYQLATQIDLPPLLSVEDVMAARASLKDQ